MEPGPAGSAGFSRPEGLPSGAGVPYEETAGRSRSGTRPAWAKGRMGHLPGRREDGAGPGLRRRGEGLGWERESGPGLEEGVWGEPVRIPENPD